MAWEFKREEGDGFAPLPVGDYRIRVENAEKVVSKTGKDMLKLTFQVSGKNSKLFHNIVFLPDRPEITNRNLTQFFDAFPGIGEGNFNLESWKGKVGACRTKQEEYNGSMQTYIHYFIKPDKAEELPPWVEPGDQMMGGTAANGPDVNIAAGVDEDVPF